MKTALRRFLSSFPFALVSVLAGCAGGTRTVDEVLRDGPLPYHVGVFIERLSLGGTAETLSAPGDPAAEETPPTLDEPTSPAPGSGGPDTARPDTARPDTARPDTARPDTARPDTARYVWSSREAVERIAEALRDPDIFSGVTVLDATTREEAVAQARRMHCDSVLALELATSAEYRDYERPAGWATLEVVSWLFGGIPSWFVPSVEYQTPSRLTAERIDLGSAPTAGRNGSGRTDAASSGNGGSAEGGAAEGGSTADGASTTGASGNGGGASVWRDGVETVERGTSLWDRSDPLDRPLQYLTTIVAPPMVLPEGQGDRLSLELTTTVTADLGAKLNEVVRRRFVEDEATAALSILLLAPDPREKVGGGAGRLRIAISSRGPGRLVGLDAVRLAAGVPLARWRAEADVLASLSEEMDTRTDTSSYVEFEIPEEIPLEPGENLVKVRALREDRQLAQRTVFYTR